MCEYNSYRAQLLSNKKLTRIEYQESGLCACADDNVTYYPVGKLGFNLCAIHGAFHSDCMRPLDVDYGRELADCKAEKDRLKKNTRKPALKSKRVQDDNLPVIIALHAEIARLNDEIAALKNRPRTPVTWRNGIEEARRIAYNRNLSRAV